MNTNYYVAFVSLTVSLLLTVLLFSDLTSSSENGLLINILGLAIFYPALSLLFFVFMRTMLALPQKISSFLGLFFKTDVNED